jgi:hypothetical protein
MTRALATLAALVLIALALSTSSSQNGTFMPPLASSTGVDVIESLTTQTLLERYKNWTQRTTNRTKRVLSFSPVAPTLVYDTALGGTTSSIKYQAFIFWVQP